jgi:hypothetical protein
MGASTEVPAGPVRTSAGIRAGGPARRSGPRRTYALRVAATFAMAAVTLLAPS